MASVLQPARVMIDPLDSFSAAVDARHWVWPALALAACVAFSGAAFALRWDAGPVVTRQLQLKGELQNTTEQELAQQIVTAERIRLVSGVAQGVFLVPLMLVLLAGILKLASWIFGTPAPFSKCFSVAVLSLLPLALFHLIFGVSALRQQALTDLDAKSLVPSSLAAVVPKLSPVWGRVASAIDFFNLWSALLLGLGFSAASGMRRDRALLLSLGLYVMYVGAFVVGLPGWMGGAR